MSYRLKRSIMNFRFFFFIALILPFFLIPINTVSGSDEEEEDQHSDSKECSNTMLSYPLSFITHLREVDEMFFGYELGTRDLNQLFEGLSRLAIQGNTYVRSTFTCMQFMTYIGNENLFAKLKELSDNGVEFAKDALLYLNFKQNPTAP
jgi:hypothetical protein